MKKFLSLALAFVLAFSTLPIFAQAEAAPEPFLYYSFDNAETVDTGDFTVSNTGVTFSDEESVSGSAAYFDGNSSYLELVGDITSYLDDDFTVSTWVRVDSPNWWMRIFDFGTESAYAFLGLYDTTDLRYALLTDETGYEINVTADDTVEDGAWMHVALVRSGNTVKIYKNGVLSASSVDFGEHTPSEVTEGNNYLGKSQFSSDAYFKGYIDEFKIYAAALTDEQVLDSMGDGVKEEFAEYLTIPSGVTGDMTTKKDLDLVSFEGEHASLTWTSSDETVISSTGEVSRGDETKTVTLTATITINGEEYVYNYVVTVPATNSVDTEINIDAASRGVDINPDMIGIFFEDINYAADGGLYAELVQNRSFEALDAQSNQTDPTPIPSYAWTIDADYSFLSDDPLNENNTTYLRISSPSENVTITNACYDGISAELGDKFDFSVFARADSDFEGKIVVTLVENGKTVGKTYVEEITSEWAKYEVEMTATSDMDNALLCLSFETDGDNQYIELDMISLFPQDTWMNRKNGLRADLVQMLKDLHPGFLRFPGGCIVEGYTLENRYSWKDTIGPVEARKENWNRWQTHTSGDGRYGYCQTYGLGFYEYFLLCEDIGAFPLPVLNVGIACQYQSGETSSEEDLYSIYIQDALDLIEFANGDPETSEWAAIRAEMGHPEPFNLEYIGIGNEQWETDSVNFYERYEAFEEAIHAQYPEIKLIATSGPSPSGSSFDSAWEWLDSHAEEDEDMTFAYAVDEHYYRTPDWFYLNLDRYDGYDRDSYKVFAGEYASRRSNTTKDSSNVEAAISIAAFMTSLEKNADVVQLASYAPLFSRDGYTQWYPDMIGFDNSRVFGTPDYYVQSMYSNNLGSYTLDTETVNYSAEYKPSGKFGIGTWNTAAEFRDFEITYQSGDETVTYTPTIEEALSGTWEGTVEEGLTQSATSGDGAFLIFSDEAAGGETDHYTITFKATKTDGSEGFCIPVLYQDENNYYLCNIGGWSNTSSAIQQVVDGSKATLSETNSLANITTGEEYTVTITVDPHKLAVYLNGDCVNFVSFRQPVYTTTSYDETSGDIIVKVVNSSESTVETLITLDGAEYINPVADVTELSSDGIYDMNSLEDPTYVSPVYFTTDVSESFTYELPANSFTIFRIHTLDDSEIPDRAVTEYITLDKGEELTLPSTVTVIYKDGSEHTLSVTWDAIPDEFTETAGEVSVEGSVDGTNLLAYTVVTIAETDEAELLSGGITVSDNTATFELYFSDGTPNADASLTAVVAAYSADNELIKVETLTLNYETQSADVDITEYLTSDKVKLFIFDEYNYFTDSVTIQN
ncbi:MAG: Ig-like domain-containing protein [Clostridia bacterium]|nr:Ig-like domain-containing protein [Clostridia bacterium]